MKSDAARFGGYVAFALPVAFALVFVRQLLEFRDPFVPWTEDAHLLLTGTGWGRTFLAGAALALLAVPAFSLAKARPGLGWPIASALVLALGAFPALTGHASAGEGFGRVVTLGADILHVWAAGGWMGGLAGILFLDRLDRRASGDSGGSLLPGLVPAFSPLAMACVALLVTTGVLASWMHVSEPLALLSSAYGRTLALKLGLVAVVMAVGWMNWRRLAPRMGTSTGPAALRRAAAVELAVAQLVLLVTAVLVRTPPPG